MSCSSSCSRAYCRSVSSISYRVDPSGSRSATTSDFATRPDRASNACQSESSSSVTTAATAAASNEPANTPSRSKTVTSDRSRSAYDHCTVARSVWCRSDRGTAAAGEEPEPLVQVRRDLGRAHGGHTCCRELECERQTVEATADLADGVQRWCHPARNRFGQLARARRRAAPTASAAASDVGYRERPERSHPFAFDGKAFTAGRQNSDRGTGANDPLGKARDRIRSDAHSCWSSTTRTFSACARTRRCSPSSVKPVRGSAPSAAAMTCNIARESPTLTSSQNHTPSGRSGSTSAATCSAGRVFADTSYAGDRHEPVVAATSQRPPEHLPRDQRSSSAASASSSSALVSERRAESPRRATLRRPRTHARAGRDRGADARRGRAKLEIRRRSEPLRSKRAPVRHARSPCRRAARFTTEPKKLPSRSWVSPVCNPIRTGGRSYSRSRCCASIAHATAATARPKAIAKPSPPVANTYPSCRSNASRISESCSMSASRME